MGGNVINSRQWILEKMNFLTFVITALQLDPMPHLEYHAIGMNVL